MVHKGYTYLDLVEEVLRVEKKDMTSGEIWHTALEKGLDKKLFSVGKTPQKTLYAIIQRDIKKGEGARLKQTGPRKYYLNK